MVRAGCVLDATEVTLHAHAHRVVGVGQLQARGVVVVEGEHLAGHPREVLQTAVSSCSTESILDIRQNRQAQQFCNTLYPNIS